LCFSGRPRMYQLWCNLYSVVASRWKWPLSLQRLWLISQNERLKQTPYKTQKKTCKCKQIFRVLFPAPIKISLFFVYLKEQGVWKRLNQNYKPLFLRQISILICHHRIRIFYQTISFFHVCITYQHNLQVYNFHCVNEDEKRQFKLFYIFC
jgi:hypothetical protein